MTENEKKLYKNWEKNHLLTCLAEECGEAMKELYLNLHVNEKLNIELNDVVAVAELLRELDIINPDLEANSIPNQKIDEALYTCLSDIQFYTHKSIRFGLYSTHPSQERRNVDNIHSSLHALILIMDSREDLSVNKDHSKKKDKVIHYLELAKKSFFV